MKIVDNENSAKMFDRKIYEPINPKGISKAINDWILNPSLTFSQQEMVKKDDSPEGQLAAWFVQINIRSNESQVLKIDEEEKRQTLKALLKLRNSKKEEILSDLDPKSAEFEKKVNRARDIAKNVSLQRPQY